MRFLGLFFAALRGGRLHERATHRYNHSHFRKSAVAAEAFIGTWDVMRWRITDMHANNGYYDDPIAGWVPGAYYRVRLTVTPGDDLPIAWRWEEHWVLSPDSGSFVVLGWAEVGER